MESLTERVIRRMFVVVVICLRAVLKALNWLVKPKSNLCVYLDSYAEGAINDPVLYKMMDVHFLQCKKCRKELKSYYNDQELKRWNIT